MVSEPWLQSLRDRHAQVRVVFPPAPVLSAEETEWAAGGAFPVSPVLPTWDDVERTYSAGDLARLPWACPVWDAGVGGVDFVPGLPSQKLPFWEKYILHEHPNRDQFVSFLRDGVGLYDMLLPQFRGTSVDQPFNPDRFRGAVFRNRIPASFTDFVDSEITSLASLGCIARWSEVRGPGGPARPRLILPLSVEESKPRLIYDARQLNACIKDFPFSMDTVGRVAGVASESCFMTSLDDKAAFHHILLRPSSWPLFGFTYKGVDYVWRVLPFGFKPSPWVYHTLADAKGAFLRSKGVPALVYLDDSLLCNFRVTHGKAPRVQWLAAAEATFVAMLVAFFCGAFLSIKKCDFKPTRLQKYLGIWCDSTTATFRVPQDKLDKLHQRLQDALASNSVSFETLRSVAGQAMSMSVAIRPASLYTQAMFAAVAALEKSGRHCIDLADRTSEDLLAEFRWWCRISTTSHEGPWQRARHFAASITRGASDASSVAWGGVVHAPDGPFQAGGVFPRHWLPTHINQKEMYALYHLLDQFCGGHPEVLRRAQVLMDVDSRAVEGAFNRGRSKNRVLHELLIQLFDLQIEYGFMLSLTWVPTAENVIADAISRPSREVVTQLLPAAFQRLWDAMGPFDLDLMACTSSAQASPITGLRLPFFSRFSCPGSAGTDMLAQNVAVMPGTSMQAFGYCFPPPKMAGHVLQHLEECRAHAVLVLPDTRPYWFPLVQLASVRSLPVASRGEAGVFQWPCSSGVLRGWKYPRWGMVAHEVDFRQPSP